MGAGMIKRDAQYYFARTKTDLEMYIVFVRTRRLSARVRATVALVIDEFFSSTTGTR